MPGKGRNEGSQDGGFHDGAPNAATLATIQALLSEQHRMSMHARTIAITLASALSDDDELRGMDERAARAALRRQWCQHVLDMLQELRANALRNRQAFEQLADQVKVGKSGIARFAAARIEFERYADRAEETATRSMEERA